jgi:hypothetical protein
MYCRFNPADIGFLLFHFRFIEQPADTWLLLFHVRFSEQFVCDHELTLQNFKMQAQPQMHMIVLRHGLD